MSAPPHRTQTADPLSVLVVGPGRLGRTAARRLDELGHSVTLIGRGQAIPASPLTWLTVPDRSIAAVAAALPPGGVRLHASGAADLEVLGPAPGRGSLHPLMTFPGPELAPLRSGTHVPAAVAGDEAGRAGAHALAAALGFTPFQVPGDRRGYHAAAVIAGNFATTLMAVAAEVLSEAGVPAADAPGLLAPLALQSVQNAVAQGPRAALTGPIVRGDNTVIEGHRAFIRDSRPGLLPTYDALVAATRALVDARQQPAMDGPQPRSQPGDRARTGAGGSAQNSEGK